MKKSLCIAAVFGFAVLAFTGCQSMYDATQPKVGEVTDFLPKHELLVKQNSRFPFQYFYMKENAKRYENLYIAPVDTSYLRKSENWAKFDKQLAGKLGDNVQKIADYMRERYIAEVKLSTSTQKPHIVDNPKAKNTVVMETAIVAIVPTKAELNALGIAGNLLLPGISVLVQQMAAGSIAIECVVRDGATGEVLAMYAAVFADQAAVINLKALSWYGSAKRNIEKAAKDTATVFLTRDYDSIKRNTPFKLITW